MSNSRFKALDIALNRELKPFEVPAHLSELYGNNVFSEHLMQEYLTKEAFIKWQGAACKGEKMSREIADQIAIAMKDWALSCGATHYTHWFQPLTGATAEKHDAFISPMPAGRAIERFHGAMLIQQEPDASSFPSGGIRNTFEARGYTAWDPSSPAFLIGTTLCIPTIFVSYTGEALDYKTPLLRALSAVNTAATQVVKYFNKDIRNVNATLGWEQEYFLIDEALFHQRPDLVFSGRTLLGHAPAKGQQLEDHYFGSIPQRAMDFIKELEVECIRLAIPVATRHNEVAPNQFELAPIFEEVNLAVDHNSLLMDAMDRLARRHHFKVLLHEKPFAGVNGSGKHNNWSLATDSGENLLAPGKNPKKNLQFLTFFINTIKAVHDYADLLRASIASLGNDHRLGANEAPPAIISVFVGDHLKKVVDDLEKITKGKLSADEKTELKLHIIGKIPPILLDNTDRNRTSPFAFTGNKFEFRAVGASAHCAEPMIALNTIVAQQLIDFKKDVDQLIENKAMKKDDAILNVLREYIESSKKIIFEGDGYSANWIKEAQKKGLSNHTTTPVALEHEIRKEYIHLFEKNGVLSERELKARSEIKFEKYVKLFTIEAEVLADMVRNYVLPAALRYQTQLIENVKGLKEIYGKDFKPLAKNQSDLIAVLSGRFSEIGDLLGKLDEERKKALAHSKISEKAKAFSEHIRPLLEKIRSESDALEMITEDALWPFPKYRELLFIR
ncbi:glutamine synthetase III [Bacteroidetes bacterium endosymbiont of Geopemphigus sp.]|uniref:glutamine synthetase III family protein n=1 Tax=Bacteroidetes bacterium endosymbiont of Geopemphigus sp. TaxID=2047937 RepID=UPI000CD06E83|nr:glutamine synthetase III [Bacteroidetes bacterium endosymbiont of Geopemphigus sp.]